MAYEKTCPNCENTMKTIPAGVSKRTGRPYESFDVCEHCNPKKGQSSAPKSDNTEVLNALRENYKINQEILKEFREFSKIFSEKNEEKAEE